MLRIAAVLIAVSAVALAQGPSVSQHYSPGDAVQPFYASFNGNPQFDNVSLYFVLDGQPMPNQKGLPTDFRIQQSQNVAPGVFKIVGTIRKCATGTYHLVEVDAAVGTARNAYSYTSGQPPITLNVVNGEANLFPPLKGISTNPPKP